LVLTLSLLSAVRFQEPPKPAPAEQSAESTVPAQIELLETKVRFERNGDFRKEVHCVIKIRSELGVRQFGHLNFDYNRSFQQIEIPFVRVMHSSGGTADILPSAITDNPHPAVVNFPAFHDVRVKSVRILGLAPSDTLEYRVITTTTHHPLAPDYWLDHNFDRSGVLAHEIFEVDVPGNVDSTTTLTTDGVWYGPVPIVYVSTPFSSFDRSGEGASARSIYHWKIDSGASLKPPADTRGVSAPDVLISTFSDWPRLMSRIAPPFLHLSAEDEKEVSDRARTIMAAAKAKTAEDILRAEYEFVSQTLITVDLPAGVSRFRLRPAKDILSSGYATPEEKCAVLAWFAGAKTDARVIFPVEEGVGERVQKPFARPSGLRHPLVRVSVGKKNFVLDPSLEIAPFGLIPSGLRGLQALSLTPLDLGDISTHWVRLPASLPFSAFQRVNVSASLSSDGTLTAKVSYTMRGDNELLLREAFHQSPREKWNEVAQLLSLSDGFRGKVDKVSASDPYATKEPITVEYEISQPKFVDWSKKPVRIPAVLPLVGLPDPPADAKSPIELGTPLDVQTTVTLHLPPDTTVESPAGTTVDRDYATFSSQYAATGNTITASRHVHFIAREIPAGRAADYGAFVRAIQSDQAQLFRLTRP
jgi:uncharacterized protein DUF3857